jgi:UDP-N-acetylmuramyl pentapeptide phosphotransferase/UDP-N-acetylglucosamine-1-phosphate transferase
VRDKKLHFIGPPTTANAFNFIDGFNRLLSRIGMARLIKLGYIPAIVNDPPITHFSINIVIAILGFFIWNYRVIFCDGAWLIGFLIANLSAEIVTRQANRKILY